MIKEENDEKNQKSTLESWPNLAFKVKLEIFEFINFSWLNLYFRWHGIEEEEICDPMEKFWVKKEF